MGLPFNIAIDGYSSCGKSTIARNIAVKYKMKYIDTGAMYRAVTLFFMRKNILADSLNDSVIFEEMLNNIHIDFSFNIDTKQSKTFLNNENVENLIRSIEISNNVSSFAKIKLIRNKLIMLQREFGKEGNVIMDGRDIGSKVFPEARLKFFVTARAEIRAKRRYDELKLKGEDVIFEDVLLNINKRDIHDTSRALNPLIKTEDAIFIDNSDLLTSEQHELICRIIERTIHDYNN